MPTHYLRLAWRHLVRDKAYAFINLLGLGIGLTVFMLLFVYVENEYSWDRHWTNADRIHWLIHDRRVNATTSFKGPYAPYLASSLLTDNFPEDIAQSARMVFRGDFIHVGDNRFPGNIALADRALLDIFKLDVVSGSLQDTLASPGRIALSEVTALRYFGNESPLGKTLTLEVKDKGMFDYQVSAVFRPPEYSSFGLSFLSLLEESALPDMAEQLQSWTGARAFHYFLLAPQADVDSINARLPGLIDRLVPMEPWRVLPAGQTVSDMHGYALQALPDAHFDQTLQINNVTSRGKVALFALIGVLVLAMGSANFVILATARAEDRRKEIGIRKALGARRGQLIVQYLGESTLLTAAAMLLALILVLLLLPGFGSLVDRSLALDLLDPMTALLVPALVLAVGALGGVYPALVLAGFSPTGALHAGSARMVGGIVSVRGVLSGFQFTIAVGLIIATLVLFIQLDFMRRLDLGFSPDNLYVVPLATQEARANITPLANELGALQGVGQVARSSWQPFALGYRMMTVGTYTHQQNGMQGDYQGIFVDDSFFTVYRMRLLAGRFFNAARDLPDSKELQPEPAAERPPLRMVVNRHLTESLGFAAPADAVGQLVYEEVGGSNGEVRTIASEIIGVVEDSKFRSLEEAIGNDVYLLSDGSFSTLTLQYEDEAEDRLPRDVEQVWKRLAGDSEFLGQFVSRSLIELYTRERNEGRLLLSFAMLSILIASMGLYGLAAYTLKRSVKEVGIRKVLGASTRNLLLLFMWRFSKPVLVANLLAWPMAVWVMLRWLQRFPEQIDYAVLLPICLVAAALSLLIAWSTVGLTTARAASAHPVKSLRYE